MGDLKVTVKLDNLLRLQKKSPRDFEAALAVAAIQFLTWANTGTGGKSSKKPPIRFGVLRGSSSAFVNGKLIEVFKQPILAGAEDAPTPATSGGKKETGTTTWVWNTDYAAKMHEWLGGWGKFTQQDGDAGNKWLEDHLKADSKMWLDVVGRELKKRLGL